MKQVKSWATDKWGPPFQTTRRDLIDGAIDSLIEALNRQKKNTQKSEAWTNQKNGLKEG